jgi:hypothetical protein
LLRGGIDNTGLGDLGGDLGGGLGGDWDEIGRGFGGDSAVSWAVSWVAWSGLSEREWFIGEIENLLRDNVHQNT